MKLGTCPHTVGILRPILFPGNYARSEKKYTGDDKEGTNFRNIIGPEVPLNWVFLPACCSLPFSVLRHCVQRVGFVRC